MTMSERVSSIMTRISETRNGILDPATRQKYIASIKDFSYERPLFFFFIITHLLLSAVPVLLFFSFTTVTILFSLTVAVLFSLFWITCALLVLASTLFVSISVGMTIWAWGVGGITVTKWVYNKLQAGDKKISKISGQINLNGGCGEGDTQFGQLNGNSNNAQKYDELTAEKRMAKRDEIVKDKLMQRRNDAVLERKILTDL